MTNHSLPVGRHRISAKLALLALLTAATTGLRAATSLNAAALLPEGARLAVAGDSITEQKQYSRFIEAYLVACAGRADVKVFQFGWGGETKEFTKEQLAAGINLAAEFPVTPFDANSAAYLNHLGGKQQFETVLIKDLVTRFRNFDGEAQADPEIAAAFDTLRKKLPARQAALDTQARQALAPVKHALKVTPL